MEQLAARSKACGLLLLGIELAAALDWDLQKMERRTERPMLRSGTRAILPVQHPLSGDPRAQRPGPSEPGK